jgi:hypothetical protein
MKVSSILTVLAVIISSIFTDCSLSQDSQSYEAAQSLNSCAISVAFLLVGSARSFPAAIVKETINKNLIHAFCPVSSCRYDIYIRVSLSDNTHVGMDAEGVVTEQLLTWNDVDKAMLSLQPRADGKIFADYINIGSEQEKDEMRHYTSKDLKHQVYHQLDSRRYSMFFNRWKAYELVLKQETLKNITYVSIFISW